MLGFKYKQINSLRDFAATISYSGMNTIGYSNGIAYIYIANGERKIKICIMVFALRPNVHEPYCLPTVALAKGKSRK